jgi:MFS family permease
MKQAGTQSAAPIRESFTRRRNLKPVLIALAMVASQSFIGYVSTFYTLTLLTSSLKVDSITANTLFLGLMLCGFVLCGFFSWLSDRVGRKPVMLAGFVLAILTYIPIFQGVAGIANPALAQAQESVPVRVIADPATCSFQFNPAGTARFTSDCDRAKLVLARSFVSYENEDAPAGSPTTVVVGDRSITVGPDLDQTVPAAVTAAGYPAPGDPGIVRISGVGDLFDPRVVGLFLLLLVLVSYAQMTQGPSASAMVELFPTRIRYSAMSLPYHIGNGWFGGLLPATAFAIVAQTGDIYAGLWYPIAVALMTVVVGLLFVPETKDRDIFAADTAEEPRERPASASI